MQELKNLLYMLYLEAGPPTLDEIAQWVSDDDDLPGAPERDTVRRCIGSVDLPANQHDATSIAMVLARRAGWDAEEVAAKIREYWIAARMTVPLGQPVSESRDPIALQVHRTIESPDAPPGPPTYLKRAHDQKLSDILSAIESKPKFIVLVGGSSTGKTRAAFEAIHEHLTDWRLYHPISPSKPEALKASLESSRLAPRTVLWLDELNEYFAPQKGDVAAVSLHEALSSESQFIALATIWPEDWDRLVTDPSPGSPAPHPNARALLKSVACRVDISTDFDLEELKLRAARDSRIQQALEVTRSTGKITQYLAAGYSLLERRTSLFHANPGAWAVLTASMDAHRLGLPKPIPQEFLKRAAPRYLDAETWGELTDSWFGTAAEDLTRMVRGAARPLTRIRPYPDEEPRPTTFLLADYLAQHGRLERRFEFPPSSFWLAATGLDDAAIQYELGLSAWLRGRRKNAAQLLQQAAQKGAPDALTRWAEWLWRAGEQEHAERLFRDAIDLGSSLALHARGRALWRDGQKEAAEEMYERAASSGQERTLREWANSAVEDGDWELAEKLFERAHKAGDPWALWWWSASLSDRGDIERAADLAELSATSAGQAPSLWWVNTIWDSGRRQRAEELLGQAAQRGNTEALWRWAEALWDAGERKRATELFQKSVDAGNEDALRRWAGTCWHAGDRNKAETLLARAVEAGDNTALWWWAMYLSRDGQPLAAEKLYVQAANAGCWFDVLRQWSEALQDDDQGDKASALGIYGLTESGTIAQPWNILDFAP
ncbi:tetratricopeptide repeat protein [Streptomyces mirabilis]|uniref:tetratricopeptide repeat protein n=1 Tax=Streptomyces mirabilis TaxID=68239 RepID=UPI00367925AA